MYPRERVNELIEYAVTLPDEQRRLIYEAMSYLVWLGRHFAGEPIRAPERLEEKRTRLLEYRDALQRIR